MENRSEKALIVCHQDIPALKNLIREKGIDYIKTMEVGTRRRRSNIQTVLVVNDEHLDPKEYPNIDYHQILTELMKKYPEIPRHRFNFFDTGRYSRENPIYGVPTGVNVFGVGQESAIAETLSNSIQLASQHLDVRTELERDGWRVWKSLHSSDQALERDLSIAKANPDMRVTLLENGPYITIFLKYIGGPRDRDRAEGKGQF